VKDNPFLHTVMFALVAVAIILLAVKAFQREVEIDLGENSPADSLTGKSWAGYRREFIVNGRVIRPRNDNDTVSEGQAYAMLRALWLDDSETFESCYRWTEKNLSRKAKFADNLLAWHYGNGANGKAGILDWNAASDADLDYALALFLAAEKWCGQTPDRCADYADKARAVAADILALETLELQNGELLLLPWPEEKPSATGRYEINPSYFSPGHYALFHARTGDSRWLALAGATYRQLDEILSRLDNVTGVGIPPDWCEADLAGKFYPAEARGLSSGWDAFRLWWRVRLDYDLRGSAEAKRLLTSRLAPFLSARLLGGEVQLEYNYDGSVAKAYESPAPLGLYAWCLDGLEPGLATRLRSRLREFRHEEDGGYGESDDYYVNSWAWFGDAVGAQRFPFAKIGSSEEREY
jgi:endoglucanase